MSTGEPAEKPRREPKASRDKLDKIVHELFSKEGPLSFSLTHGIQKGGKSAPRDRQAALYGHQYGVPTAALERAILFYTDQQEQQARASLQKVVAYIERQPPCDLELRKLIRESIDASVSEKDYECDVWMVKQLMWQVKNHARGLSERVEYHTLIMFWSVNNGTGKSKNVDRLCLPFAPFVKHSKLPQLVEPFASAHYGNAYIVRLDEFAGYDGRKLEEIKGIISGEAWNARLPHSSEAVYCTNLSSFVGTSNHRPPHQFKDTSGARRLWSIHMSEIPMDETPDRIKRLDAIDMMKVWNAYPSDGPSPYLAMPAHLREHVKEVREKSLRARTPIEAFVEDMLEEDSASTIFISELRKHIKDYLADRRLSGKQELRDQDIKDALQQALAARAPRAVVSTNNRPRLRGFKLREDVDTSFLE